ncbi:LPO_1073/Vpar_1526 family protein [Kribbella sp. NPDC003557]|uniref:LPO_1073/Vpar_1526 family protein n=1 Tax=Kribbella sp. NPDC003557 TaxID=3154449 RepID=UPI0033A92AE3
MKDQSQHGGDDSVNVQAGGAVNIEIRSGVTAAEVTDIALSIARDNMVQLRGYTQELVDARIEHFVDLFIKRISEHPRAHLDAVKDPDVQYSLLVAEKEYARSGDGRTAELLVDLLVNRCTLEERGLQALVLNEAIDTVGRLTARQIRTLTASWLVTRVVGPQVDDAATYSQWLTESIGPFFDIGEHISEYQHLAFLGCVSFDGPNRAIGYVVGQLHPWAFAKGFNRETIVPSLRSFNSLFKPCVNDPSLLQVNVGKRTSLDELAELNRLDVNEAATLRNLFTSNIMSEWEVQERLVAAHPPADQFIERWNNSKMLQVNVTSVGLAIAYANWTRLLHAGGELSVWIPESI